MGIPPAQPRELSRGGSIVKVVKEEDKLLHSVKEKNVDDLLDASSSPSDLDAKSDDASFVKEMAGEEEEQLDEEKWIEEPVRLASDPMAPFSKFDVLLTQTQLYTEFILENMLKQSSEQAKLVPLVSGAKLKPYQLEGVKWLIALWQNGLNGILADEMILGEKIQSIGFLAHLKGPGLHGPYMIIAPATTLTNWVDEISRLAPSLTLTSYEMAMSDAKLLARYDWKYVVFYEGHQLNLECELLLELRRLPVDNSLLLTRTPFQSNLAELWSLLNFVLPHIFSSHQYFESWFDFTGKRGEEQLEETIVNKRALVVSKLHAILDPFLLRQTKKHVENTPPRTKGAFCCNTKGVKNKDGINLSKDHTVRDGAGSSGQSSQEAAAEVADENGREGSPNLPSTQPDLEVNKKVKRRRTDDAVVSLLGQIKSTFQASFKTVEPVLVPKATPPREILEALKQIPDLTRADT
ncbi:unnamed protein product [Alopecurus aequalis]